MTSLHQLIYLAPFTWEELEVLRMHNNFRQSVRTGSVKRQPAGPLVKDLVSDRFSDNFYIIDVADTLDIQNGWRQHQKHVTITRSFEMSVQTITFSIKG